MERRREGRYKTFDWAEFRPQNNRQAQDKESKRTKALCSLELGDLERRKRREERRRRYESMLGISLGSEVMGDTTTDDSIGALSPKVEGEIEECWKRVEKTVFRLERTVPLLMDARDTVETKKLLDSNKKEVSALNLGSTGTNKRYYQ